MWPPACQSSAGTLLAGAGPRLLWRELVPGVSLPLWLEGSSRDTGVRAWTRPAWRRLCGTAVQLRMHAGGGAFVVRDTAGVRPILSSGRGAGWGGSRWNVGS